jgi:hypothetical protein
MAAIRETNATHRKCWEWCFILEALRQSGSIRAGSTGIGFGVGQEPTVAALASFGIRVLATDQPPSGGKVWEATEEYAGSLASLRNNGICDPAVFDSLVTFRHVDMKHLPDSLGEHDFVWSSCCLEHLGSIDDGLKFILDSLDLLKPGGVAVHTTEFDLLDNDPPVHVFNPDTVFFRRRDIEALVLRLRRDGHSIECNFNVPRRLPADAYIDRPPYRHDPHLRLEVENAVATSFGLIIRKSVNRAC